MKPGSSFTAFDHSALSGTSAQDCSSCHTWPGTGTASAANWLGAAGSHASSGTTKGSTLDCNTCHGQSGSATLHLSVAASSHYGGVSNGNGCITCHINFAGFKDTTTNLLYPHANATADASGCGTCHAFQSQIYTTLTNTPSLTYAMSAGSHSFSQTQSVTGSHEDRSFTSAHTSSNMTNCGACHSYSSTTSSTNIWTFVHEPKNPGVNNGKSSNGCNMCH